MQILRLTKLNCKPYKKQNKLKQYLTKYISSEISQLIISQLELIDETIKKNNPESIKLTNQETEKFIENTILTYEAKLENEEKLRAEEKRKEEERLAEEKRKEEERLAEEKT